MGQVKQGKDLLPGDKLEMEDGRMLTLKTVSDGAEKGLFPGTMALIFTDGTRAAFPALAPVEVQG